MNVSKSRYKPSLPTGSGLGLKTQHLVEFVETRPEVGFVEIHAENYMVKGGAKLHLLEQVRADYPLSIHGVAASLGGSSALDINHLNGLKRLVDRFEPAQFSEHLAWSTHEGIYFNDLLPVPYTRSTLDRVVGHIVHLQEFIGRQILIENPSTYLQFTEADYSEPQFLSELIDRSGCGLLLDLNNVFVSCQNHGWDTGQYIEALPLSRIGEIHVAGYSVDHLSDGTQVLIDSHDAEVCTEVWSMFEALIARCGSLPTLLERDGKVPELSQLLNELALADRYLNPASSLSEPVEHTHA